MEFLRREYAYYRWKDATKRMKSGELDDTDLQYESLRTRLTGLKKSEITDLITKIKAFQTQRDQDIANPAVKDPDKKKPITTAKIIEWLEVRKEISTPMPDDATVNKDPITDAIQSFSLTVNNVKITVLADTYSNNGNDTGPTTNFGKNYKWGAHHNVVDSLNDTTSGSPVAINPTSLEVTIVTRYPDAASPNEESAYGRGTTVDDKSNNTTTLRVHEGSHGTDYINYIRKNKFPVDISNGVVNKISVSDMKAIDKYISGIAKESCETTDQVGYSQDTFLITAEGRRSGITSCRK
jgi:hypothetical protein